MALAAAQAVLAIHMSWSTQAGAAPWLQRLEACAAAAADLPPGDRLRVATAVVCGADMGAEYRVNETNVAAEIQNALTMLETRSNEIDANDRLIAADALQDHALDTATIELFERTVAAATPYLADHALTPWVKCHWLISFGVASGRRWPYRKEGFPYASAEDALRDAWTIAQHEGLASVRFAATFNLINVARGKGDRFGCDALVARLESEYDPAKPTQAVHFLFQKGTQLGWAGQYEAALTVQKAVEEAATRAQTSVGDQWTYRMSRPQILIGLGRFDEARALAHKDASLYSGVFKRSIEIIGNSAELLVARREGAPDYVDRLRACMHEVAEMSWTNYMTAIPLIVSELWADALERGIETAFITAAIRRRNLAAPLTYAPSWPWPLRVRVLGRLEIERDGTPVAFGAKAPKKPLELLKVLACAAAHAVDVRQVLAWLWPDADTDAAKAALDVATHRLRKFLGDDEALLLAGGKLQLSPDRVWLDATAFATWLDQAQSELDAKPELPTANLLAERLYRDYRGRLFGDDEPTPWSIGPRERLHQKFLQLTGSLGRCHEVRRDWTRATEVYERGLAEDPLAEELYRGLIRCYLGRNEPAAALHAFRRCREVLSVVLGVSPAPATMALVSKVRGAGG
jgi:DNA-binding SARP family transcriptional activator